MTVLPWKPLGLPGYGRSVHMWSLVHRPKTSPVFMFAAFWSGKADWYVASKLGQSSWRLGLGRIKDMPLPFSNSSSYTEMAESYLRPIYTGAGDFHNQEQQGLHSHQANSPSASKNDDTTNDLSLLTWSWARLNQKKNHLMLVVPLSDLIDNTPVF